jgi:site-specific DNA-methyltransferase (adenine-specific)
MKDLSDASVDCFICDLPYGCLSVNGKPKVSEEKMLQYGKGRIPSQPGGCMWDIKIDLDKFWEQVRRLRKSDSTPCLMFCTTKFGIDLINSNPKEFRYDLVWDKGRGVSFLSANWMPMRSHEMIYVFSKSRAYYKRIDISGNPYITTGNSGSKTYSKDWKQKHEPKTVNTRCALSVVSVPTKATGKRDKHPTEKSSSLYRFLIERYCPEGGTVLDPTAGSFNSVFTAYDMNRNGIGIEKDDTFYKKACDRFNSL